MSTEIGSLINSTKIYYDQSHQQEKQIKEIIKIVDNARSNPIIEPIPLNINLNPAPLNPNQFLVRNDNFKKQCSLKILAIVSLIIGIALIALGIAALVVSGSLSAGISLIVAGGLVSVTSSVFYYGLRRHFSS